MSTTKKAKEPQVNYLELASDWKMTYPGGIFRYGKGDDSKVSLIFIVIPSSGAPDYGFKQQAVTPTAENQKAIDAAIKAAGKAEDEAIYFIGDVMLEPKSSGDDFTVIAHNLVYEPTMEEVKKKIPVFVENIKKVNKAIDARLVKEKEEMAKEFEKRNNIKTVPKDLYIDAKVWSTLGISLNIDKYVILLGPKGCGKTQTAQEIAKAYGMDYVSFNMGAAFKPKQMFCGMLQAEDGSTKFVESEFLKAFTSDEPTLIFLDEITRTPQAASNYLMTILDRNQSYIYIEELGKRVYKGKGVKFIAAGNVGQQYTDTRAMDGALWDRFIKVPVDYLPFNDELKLIMERAPKANKKAVETLIKRAQKCREAEKSGDLSSGISTRQLIDMAHFLENGLPLEDVYEIVFLNNFINGNASETDEARTLCQSV